MQIARITKPLMLALLAWAIAGPAAAGSTDGASRAASAGRSLLGQPAPAAILRTIDGRRIDLSALYGRKPVYLKFWATWCAPCQRQMPGFARIHRKYGKRIEIIAVNAGFNDTEAAVRAYRARFGLHMPIVIDDGSLGRKLNLRVTPQHVLIARDGRIVHVGHLDGKELEAALEQAIEQTPVMQTPALAPQATALRTFGTGDPVRGLALSTIDGASASIGGAGKPQALVFFSPWCESYLRDSQPDTARACRRVREEGARLARTSAAAWLAISAPLWATEAELADYARTHPTGMPIALDAGGEVFAAFGIRRIPSIVLLDAGGRLARIFGPDEPGLEAALRALGQARSRP
jgi:thiol-disulfide isomerase/thioredoxin